MGRGFIGFFRNLCIAAVSMALVLVVSTPPSWGRGLSPSTIIANATRLSTAPSTALRIGGDEAGTTFLSSALTKYKALGAVNAQSFGSYDALSSQSARERVVAGSLTLGVSEVPLNFASTDVGPGASGEAASAQDSDFEQIPIAVAGLGIGYNINFPASITVSNGAGTATVRDSCASLLARNRLILSGVVLGRIVSGLISDWSSASIEVLNPRLRFRLVTPRVEPVVRGGSPVIVNGVARTKVVNVATRASCLSFATQESIDVVGTASGSADTFTLTDYLSKVDPGDFPPSQFPSAQSLLSAGTVVASSSQVPGAVMNADGAIGYVDSGTGVATQVAMARLYNSSGVLVSPTANAVRAAASAQVAKIQLAGNFSPAFPGSSSPHSTVAFSITNAPNGVAGPSSYPLATLVFATVSRVQSDQATGVALVKFLLFLSQRKITSGQAYGQNFISATGLSPLPSALRTIAYSDIAAMKNPAGAPLISSS